MSGIRDSAVRSHKQRWQHPKAPKLGNIKVRGDAKGKVSITYKTRKHRDINCVTKIFFAHRVWQCSNRSNFYRLDFVLTEKRLHHISQCQSRLGRCATCYPQSRVLCFAVVGLTFKIFNYVASPLQCMQSNYATCCTKDAGFYGAPLTDMAAVCPTFNIIRYDASPSQYMQSN